jgi:hypothetical protein
LKPRKAVSASNKTSTDYSALMKYPGNLGARVESDSCSIKRPSMFQGSRAQWAATKLIREPSIAKSSSEGGILPSMVVIMVVKFLKARKASGISVRAANPDHQPIANLCDER